MTPKAESAIVQAEGALGLLQGQERNDAEALIELCRDLFQPGASATPQQRTHLGRLIEVLARRSATAMPYAALARALSAHLSGDERNSAALLNEFQQKLVMLGM